MIRYLVSFLVFTAVIYCAQQVTPSNTGKKALSEGATVDLLKTQIRRDSVYSIWTCIECLSFVIEDSTSEYFGIAVRERHGGGCPGDTLTAPVVDRFRVYRSSHSIRWWNADSNSGDGYEPWETFVGYRK
jgi:hypothetical protein